MRTRVKICGITSPADAGIASKAGADYIGVIVDIAGSPRSVSDRTAKSIADSVDTPVILLLEKASGDVQRIVSNVAPAGVQLIGDYRPQDIALLKSMPCALWKTLRVPRQTCSGHELDKLRSTLADYHAAGVDAVVLDTLVEKQKGGTGQTCDWNTAAGLVAGSPLPIFLAGGITPENAGAAAQKVRPYGLDLSSGVEKQPGRKDPRKIAALMNNLRTACCEQGVVE